MKFETIQGFGDSDKDVALLSEDGYVIEFGYNTGNIFVYETIAKWEMEWPMPKLCKTLVEAIKLIEEDLCV